METRVVRAAPIDVIYCTISFLTFSKKSDPRDIEKVWLSLCETISFEKKPTLKQNLRKMRLGKETLAPGCCTKVP